MMQNELCKFLQTLDKYMSEIRGVADYDIKNTIPCDEGLLVTVQEDMKEYFLYIQIFGDRYTISTKDGTSTYMYERNKVIEKLEELRCRRKDFTYNVHYGTLYSVLPLFKDTGYYICRYSNGSEVQETGIIGDSDIPHLQLLEYLKSHHIEFILDKEDKLNLNL